MNIFMDSLMEIAEHNDLFKAGKLSYHKDINEFSDITDDEFHSHSRVSGYGSDNDENADEQKTHQVPNNDGIPETVDWRALGAVTSVKRQNCGDCWSFAAAGAVEGAHFIKTGIMRPLSAQNILDCVDKDKNHCYPGTYVRAFDYIKENGGIDTEESYPYAWHKHKCRYDSKHSGATVSGYVLIPRGNETALTHAIATVGPIAIAINGRFLRHYKGGVFHHKDCVHSNLGRDLSHEVLAVGYGTSDEYGDYYILKDSKGPHWGDNGYFYLARNRDNQCGVAEWAGYPIVGTQIET